MKTVKIEGMMCMHCVGHVEEALNKISAIFFYMIPEGCLLYNDFRYLFALE